MRTTVTLTQEGTPKPVTPVLSQPQKYPNYKSSLKERSQALQMLGVCTGGACLGARQHLNSESFAESGEVKDGKLGMRTQAPGPGLFTLNPAGLAVFLPVGEALSPSDLIGRAWVAEDQ